MNYGNEKTVAMYVDFLWDQIKYWQGIAAKHKEDIESYRKLTDALVTNGIISEEELLTIWDEVDEGLYDNKDQEINQRMSDIIIFLLRVAICVYGCFKIDENIGDEPIARILIVILLGIMGLSLIDLI